MPVSEEHGGRLCFVSILGALMLSAGMGEFWVQDSYLRTPEMRGEDVEAGRTEPYATKGITLYLTRKEYLLVRGLEGAFVGLSGVLGLTLYFLKYGNPFKKGPAGPY
jgi:hypothetical protein